MKEKEDLIPDNFLDELFHCTIKSRNAFEVVRSNLKMHYIANPIYKKLWKEIQNQYLLSSGKSVTVGSLKLSMRLDSNLLDCLADVLEADINDVGETLTNFQVFIKQKKFIELFQDCQEKYNKGQKNQAYSALYRGAEDLNNLSVKDKYYEKVFADFPARQAQRAIENSKRKDKIPTGIDALDQDTNGGFESGEAVLWLGDSGVGKSILLLHLCIVAARRGFRSALFSAEGTKKQTMDRFDAAWTGTIYHEMKNGLVDDHKYEKLMKIINKMHKDDIYVECFEKFGSKTILDVRNGVIDLKKLYGNLGLVALDYLELVDPGDGRSYSVGEERFRQTSVARSCKDIAMEQELVFHTVTQASSIAPEILNDPDQIITRFHLSEDKGKLRPFDALITMNQTKDEKRSRLMRLYNDKLRDHESGQTNYVIQNLGFSRFYDRKATINFLAELDLMKEATEEDD